MINEIVSSMFKNYNHNIYGLHRGVWHLILEGWFEPITYDGKYAITKADNNYTNDNTSVAITYEKNAFCLRSWPTFSEQGPFCVLTESDLLDGIHLICHPRPHMIEQFDRDTEYLNKSIEYVKPDFEEMK